LRAANCLAALVVLAAGVSLADDAEFAARVKADTEWLCSYGTRQVGTPEHRRVQDDMLAKVRAIPGVQVWTQEFPVVVPVNGETFLEIGGDALPGQHRLFPVWPDVARLNTTPAKGIRGRLVYVGEAEYEQLPAHGLRGNIAVMEMSAYASYRRAFDYGAVAVIFVEGDQPGKPLPSAQSLYKPRYYVPAGPLADALRGGDVTEGRIVCRGSWKTITARNIYAGVKPANSTDVTPYAMVAPYDSMSRVMGIAPGADAAIDCAAVLNVLRDEAADPTRALLFGFVDAYHINQLGMRHMAAMLTVIPDGRTRHAYEKIEKEDLAEYREAAEELARIESAEAGLAVLHDRYACKHLRRLFKDAVGPELLHLKSLQGELNLASRRTEDENTPAVRTRMRAALADAAEDLLEDYRGELPKEGIRECEGALEFGMRPAERGTENTKSAGEAALAWFEEARERAKRLKPICTRPLHARNRVLEAVYSEELEVDADFMPVARTLWQRMAARIRGQLEEQERRITFFEPMDRLRAEIAEHFALSNAGVNSPASSFVVGLDLSDCGIQVGPGTTCRYNRFSLVKLYRDFYRTLKFAVKRGDLWPEGSPSRRSVNIDLILGRPGVEEDTHGDRPLITAAGRSFLLPGVTWVTTDASRLRGDSPLDRYDRLDWARIELQLPPTLRFFEWVFTTSDSLCDFKPVSQATAKWRHGMGRIVDVSAGETVPRVPRSGLLVTLVGEQASGIGPRADVDGIRVHEFTWSGADGTFRLPILCADVFYTKFNAFACNLDETGAITESLTTAESLVTAKLATSFVLTEKPGEKLPRAVTFECAELNGPAFFDARFLEPLSGSLAKPLLLDTVRGGAPKQVHFNVDANGQMWGLVEPDIMWQLILRAGAARTRLALLNVVPDGRERGLSLRQTFQRGYTVDEPLPSIPAHISARDISVLNDWRLKDFQSAGIKSEKIDDVRVATAEFLAAADEALARDDGAALQRAATEALASEIRAYRAVKDVGQDIARGAIFLMLMLVPFCVAMERLLFACARIGRQIASSIAIFATMTVILWSFHPAFRISAQPLVIVMAFTILAMSVIVISMVLSRFKGSVREFQSSLAEGSGAQMGRGGLIGSAIFLGIANMRKRKVRTLLTGSTIVLVTFALLCFSSASGYIDKKDFRLEDVGASHPAVLVRRPTFGPMHENAIPALHNLLGAEDVDIGERIWHVGGLGATTWRQYLINPDTGKQVGVQGLLGLPPIEDKLTGVDRVLANWPAFAEQGGCYLSPETADQLGVAEGDTVVVRGADLVVRGIFDPIRLEDEITLLDGQRITPYDYTRQEKDWVSRDSQDAIEQETGSAAAMQPAGSDAERYISARELVVLPAAFLRELGAKPRSFGVACASPEQAKAVADKLTQTIVFPAYYSNDQGGVNVLVSTPLIAVPPKNLAIPLVIAALIIFTTMLNSVSERKSEIYVYTSLGLAPTHVGALFVAEALTYGLMGAVFGYIAGQGTATALTGLGFMQGVTLNYSGTAVIKTMLLVQGVVVLSAIVPAIVAGKIAAPSTEMDWHVPEPVDGVIRDVLPFTVSPSAAAGLVAFIHEYLEAHRDGVLGVFDVDRIKLLAPGDGGCVAGLETRLWLEPYDMGVRQWMRLWVGQPEDGACGISVEIRHEAGTPKVWWRLNKPFFFDLRRQLLGWRKLSDERVAQYVSNAGWEPADSADSVDIRNNPRDPRSETSS